MGKKKVDHYETLGVGSKSTPEEIRKAWRRRAAQAHPDRGGSVEEMARINVAYETLTDAARRARYDETGEEEAPVKSMQQRGRDTMIATFAGYMLDDLDPLERTRAALASEVEAKHSNLRGAEKVLLKLRKLETRLKRYGTDANVLQIATRQKCAEVELDIASFKDRLEVLGAAIVELGLYGLGPDPDAEPASGKAWLRIGDPRRPGREMTAADANAVARDFWKGR